jgi:hypothetical protein
MSPPKQGLEPALLASVPPAAAHADPTPPPAALDVSASMWRHALDLHVPRLTTDVYTAVILLDGSDQQWLVQRGDRPDPACVPTCSGDLKLRVEVYRLTAGPFRVAVLASSKPIPPIPMEQWVQHAGDRPPAGLGVRAYGVAKVEHQ